MAVMCGECNLEEDTRPSTGEASIDAMDIDDEYNETTRSTVEDCVESEKNDKMDLEEQSTTSADEADGHVSTSRGNGEAGSVAATKEQNGLATTLFEATMGWLPWHND